jgi:cell wall-associated NlpC family hydrolase
MSRRTTLLVLALLGLLVPLLLACTTEALTLTTIDTPSWACPSPTPKPYGEAGPVKEEIRRTDPTTGAVRIEEVFYDQWEQEYSALGGPPFPSPTPYVVVGTTFSQGQRVRVPPLFVQLTVRSAPALDPTQQLYLIDLIWQNPLAAPVAIDYAAQLRLRAITTAEGRTLTSDRWGVDNDALLAYAANDALPTSVPPGESSATIPILAPAGSPQTVELTFSRDRSYVPGYGTTPTAVGGPSPYPVASPTPAASPTPVATPTTGNGALRAPDQHAVVMQFVIAEPSGPPCASAGAMTDWQASTDAMNGVPDAALSAPPGSNRVVQLALNQVGKAYVWGAVGPERFDCSGLMIWAYSQISVRIPYRTTKDQFARMRSVSISEAQPGDLVYFEPSRGAGVVTHVGMLVGDITGDGKPDLVHAASPRLGVRTESDIFGHPFYGNPATCRMCILGIRTTR